MKRRGISSSVAKTLRAFAALRRHDLLEVLRVYRAASGGNQARMLAEMRAQLAKAESVPLIATPARGLVPADQVTKWDGGEAWERAQAWAFGLPQTGWPFEKEPLEGDKAEQWSGLIRAATGEPPEAA